MKEEILKKIDTKYPPGVFLVDDGGGKGHMERGFQCPTEIRRLTQQDRETLEFIGYLIGEKLI